MISEDPEYFYAGGASYDPTYTDKDGLRVGRVEVCADGQFRTICYDMWDDNAATVVCTDLGFSPYGNFNLVYHVKFQCFITKQELLG